MCELNALVDGPQHISIRFLLKIAVFLELGQESKEALKFDDVMRFGTMFLNNFIIIIIIIIIILIIILMRMQCVLAGGQAAESAPRRAVPSRSQSPRRAAQCKGASHIHPSSIDRIIVITLIHPSTIDCIIVITLIHPPLTVSSSSDMLAAVQHGQAGGCAEPVQGASSRTQGRADIRTQGHAFLLPRLDRHPV